MWKQLFGEGPWFRDVRWDDLPIAGLLFFFLFFVLAVVWVFRRGSRKHYDAVAQLPLDDRPPTVPVHASAARRSSPDSQHN